MYELRFVSVNGSSINFLLPLESATNCPRTSLKSGRESRCVTSLLGIAPSPRYEIWSLVKPASRASLNGVYPTGHDPPFSTPPHIGSSFVLPGGPYVPRVRGWTRSIDASTPYCIICTSGTRSPASG